VEKRPSRHHGDNRTILEKAQARKKVVNLEATQGISKSHNPFSVLSSVEIASIAKDVGINLGDSVFESRKAILEVQESDLVRMKDYKNKCEMCQFVRLDNNESSRVDCGCDGEVGYGHTVEDSTMSLVDRDADVHTLENLVFHP
jgi:hypothetical protein